MIIFLLSIILIFITSYSYGVFFNYIFLRKYNFLDFDLGEITIVGFFFLLIISIFFHFFIPINYIFTTSILIIALFYFLLNFYKFEKKNSYKILIIFLISFIGFISSKSHPDFEWYHLPYLNYIQNYKIVLGIVNISDFLGYSQTWNDIIAVFRIPIIDYRVANFAPVVFCICIVCSLLKYAKTTNNQSIKVFIYLILLFVISKYYKFNEYGGHVPPIFLAFLINVYFFIFIIEGNETNKNSLIFKTFIFSFFLIFLRVNYLFILPIISYFLIFHLKSVFKFLLDKKIFLLLIFITLIFFIKNILVSGCLYYPIDFTCFSSVKISWSVGPEYAKERLDLIKALARGWSSYVMIDGNISSRIDYFDPLQKGLILNPSEYLSTFKYSWISYWSTTGDAKKLLNNCFIVFFCFLFLLFKSNILKVFQKKNYLYKKYLIIFFVFSIQIFFCYLLTPQTIYGADVASIVFLSFISSFFLQNINFNHKISKISLSFLFIISLGYFEYKNLFRVYDEFINEKITFSKPWLNAKENYLNVDYYKYTINNHTFNVKNKQKNRHNGLPDYCGNIPMFCLPEDRKICINNIKIKNRYYFVEGNNKACLNHLKTRYFY